MTKMSHSIIAKIKQGARHPFARWQFLVHRGVIWLLTVMSMLLVAGFLGSLLADFITAEWELAPRWPGHMLGFLWDAVAWLWIGGAVIALGGGVLFFRLTRRGYRYGLALIVGILAATGIVAGVLLLPTDIPNYFHAWHDQYLPPSIESGRFNAPEDGRLLGEITAVADSETAYLEAVDGKNWELWLLSNDPAMPDDFVTVFGEVIDETTFAALEIRPVPPHYSVQGLSSSPRILR